jgi:hypothetical protein
MPMLKTIFDKLNSMLTLSTIKTMTDIGYSPGETIPILTKQYNLKKSKKQNDASGLMVLLSQNNFIDAYEGADLKISISNGNFTDALKRLLKERLDNIQALNETVSEVIKNMTVLLIAIPLILTMTVLADVMALISDMIGG